MKIEPIANAGRGLGQDHLSERPPPVGAESRAASKRSPVDLRQREEQRRDHEQDVELEHRKSNREGREPELRDRLGDDVQLHEELVEAPPRPIGGKVHAIARVRKLVQKGASAMMKSAIWIRRVCTFRARKYATGKPKTRQAATAMTDVTNEDSMLSQ